MQAQPQPQPQAAAAAPLKEFTPPKHRNTSVLIVRVLLTGEHFIVASLSTRSETLLIRIDPVDGSLHFDWRPGAHVFPNEMLALDYLKPFGDLDTRARACAVLGYAAFNDTAMVLLATRVRTAVTLPGGHQITTVSESQWLRIPIQGEPDMAQMSREEMKKLDLLTEFPLDGAYFFCETADATRPFPSDAKHTDPAWEWVWNRWLSSPFRALGLHDLCPNLQQGMAEARVLDDASGQKWVLAEISRRSRLHPGTRYLARGLNDQASAGNEIEGEQLVWRIPSEGEGKVQWSSFVWRRGSVPIWWGVEIKNSGVGEAEIWVNTTHTYRGSGKYFKRLQQRYVQRVGDPNSDQVGAAAVPVTCVNLLRCAMGKSEVLLSEHFHEAIRRIRKQDPERELMVLNFDWHATVKSLGEESAVEGLWSLLSSIQPKANISCGVLEPEGNGCGNGTMVTEWPGGWQIRWKRQQFGILRFNCADSLDRTNVASYFSATMSLVEQTKAVGLSIVGRVYLGSRRGQQQGMGDRASSSSGSLASLSKVLPKSLAKSVDDMTARMARSTLTSGKASSDSRQSLDLTRAGEASSAECSAPTVLPPGWESRKDPVTGRTFYIDHKNKATSWKCPGLVVQLAREESETRDSESDAESTADEMPALPIWGLFGWTVAQVKGFMLPDTVTAQAELFLINGDLQAMFYTASRAMHSQSICLLEGKRNRMNRTSGMGVAINAGLAVQRRFINLVQDENRMAQMEVFLGLKMQRHFPSVAEYTEPVLPDDVSDCEEDDAPPVACSSGTANFSARAHAAAERAAAAAFSNATRPPLNHTALLPLGTGSLSPPGGSDSVI